MLLGGIIVCFKTVTHLDRKCAASSLSGPIYLQAVSMYIMKSVKGNIVRGDGKVQ